jgi:hypothetical protein
MLPASDGTTTAVGTTSRRPLVSPGRVALPPLPGQDCRSRAWSGQARRASSGIGT